MSPAEGHSRTALGSRSFAVGHSSSEGDRVTVRPESAPELSAAQGKNCDECSFDSPEEVVEDSLEADSRRRRRHRLGSILDSTSSRAEGCGLISEK